LLFNDLGEKYDFVQEKIFLFEALLGEKRGTDEGKGLLLFSSKRDERDDRT